ncbi:MAG: AMIN domain-containing protein, partial [Terriglobales bacterium]
MRSRCLRLLAAALTLAVLLPASAEARPERRPSKRSVPNSRQQAQVQFESAERMRHSLEAQPTAERTRSEYRRVLDAYWRVYRISPVSPRAHEALNTMAQLKTGMGRIFDDRSILEGAIEQFEFLRREYPGSRYRWEALLTVAEIQRDDLENPAKAREAYQEFLRRYPDHKLADVARAAIEDLNAPGTAAKRVPEKKSAPRREEAVGAPAAVLPKPAAPNPSPAVSPGASAVSATLMPLPRSSDRPALVTNIRHWSGADYTRIAIDLEHVVKYEAGRIPDPDRIFFDLHGAKLSPEWIGKTIEVEGGGFLRRIRLGQYQRNITRVVLEVDAVSEYSAFLLPDPYRMVIDVHGRTPVKVAESKIPAQPASAGTATRKQPEPKTESVRTVASVPKEAKSEAPRTTTTANQESRPESKPESKPEKPNPSAVTVAIGPPAPAASASASE